MAIFKKNQREIPAIKNTKKMKNALMNSIVDWTWMRTESLSLRICQQKRAKLKSKDKKWQKKLDYPRTVGNYKRCNIYIIGIPENKEKTK